MVKIEKNVNLKKYNTYGIGGNARFFILAKEKQDLVDGYRFAKKEDLSYVVLGGGSNVLISDGAFDGLVIVNKTGEIEKNGNKIKVSSGVTLAKMINYMKEEGLTGGEFLAGIPGTLGGAILGNAGAWGKEIKDILDSVEFLDENGVRQVGPRDLKFSYRESSFKQMDGIILSAVLSLKKDSSENVSKNVREILQRRKGKHPQGRTCGSFFKNIETSKVAQDILEKVKDWEVSGKIPAGKLIEEAGCKGMQARGAEVSEVHANFLVNKGDASSNDIKELAKQIQKKVFDKFEIELEPEVRYL